MPPKLRRLVQHPLAERRTSAAFTTGREHDFKPRRLQHRHRRLANMRLVVTDEGIVPQNNAPPLRSADVLVRSNVIRKLA